MLEGDCIVHNQRTRARPKQFLPPLLNAPQAVPCLYTLSHLHERSQSCGCVLRNLRPHAAAHNSQGCKQNNVAQQASAGEPHTTSDQANTSISMRCKGQQLYTGEKLPARLLNQPSEGGSRQTSLVH